MSARERSDIALSAHIHEIHRRSRGTYGSPTIHAERADDHGIRVGKKHVARLMREAGLREATLRKLTVTTVSEPATRGTPDLAKLHRYGGGKLHTATWELRDPSWSGPCTRGRIECYYATTSSRAEQG